MIPEPSQAGRVCNCVCIETVDFVFNFLGAHQFEVTQSFLLLEGQIKERSCLKVEAVNVLKYFM